MSDTEIDYAETEYQKTDYGGSDEESQWEDDEEVDDQGDELPEVMGGKEDEVPEAPKAQAGPTTSLDAAKVTHNGPSLPRAVLEILQERWPAWKAAEKGQRKIRWKGIVAELRALEMHQTMDKVEWVQRLKAYLAWMHSKGRVRANRNAFRLGQRWTGRSVIQETHKKQLKKIIEEDFEAPAGLANIEYYQPALNELMRGLLAEELTKAMETAVEWNNQAAPKDVQARYDFNSSLENGPTFGSVQAIQGPFDWFLSKCFNADGDNVGEARQDKAEGSQGSGKSQKNAKPKSRGEQVKSITRTNGDIWIPEVANAARVELQGMVWGFLTAHYRKVSGKQKASAPFKKLAQFQDMLFKSNHLPPGFIFPDDPSHMKQEGAKQFLAFIRQCQIKHPEDIFGFEYWLGSNNELRDPVETWDDVRDVGWRTKSVLNASSKDRENTASEESDAEQCEANTEGEEASEVGFEGLDGEEESSSQRSKGKGKEKEIGALYKRTVTGAVAEKGDDVLVEQTNMANARRETTLSQPKAPGHNTMKKYLGAGKSQTAKGSELAEGRGKGMLKGEEPQPRAVTEGKGKQESRYQTKTPVREQTPGPPRQPGQRVQEATNPLVRKGGADMSDGDPKSKLEIAEMETEQQDNAQEVGAGYHINRSDVEIPVIYIPEVPIIHAKVMADGREPPRNLKSTLKMPTKCQPEQEPQYRHNLGITEDVMSGKIRKKVANSLSSEMGEGSHTLGLLTTASEPTRRLGSGNGPKVDAEEHQTLDVQLVMTPRTLKVKQAMSEQDVEAGPETPRRSGHARRAPLPVDSDVVIPEGKAKKRKSRAINLPGGKKS